MYAGYHFRRCPVTDQGSCWQQNRKLGKEGERVMLENCVFKVSVDTKRWLKAASIRAVKTVAQVAIAGIGTAAALGQINWRYVISASVLAGVISILTSIAGIPETPAKK